MSQPQLVRTARCFFFEIFRQRWVTVTTTGNPFHRDYVPHGSGSSCFADKPHTDTITEKRETVTVQDKFSELDTSEMVLIQFADTEYYLTVSRKNDTDLHDVEVSKRQYHSIGKGSKVKCIVTYRNGKVDDIEIDED